MTGGECSHHEGQHLNPQGFMGLFWVSAVGIPRAPSFP